MDNQRLAKAIADLFTMLDRNQSGVIDEAEQEQVMKKSTA